MGQNVDQLLGEKDEISKERERLSQEVQELRRLREVAEIRNAEYNKLLSKLNKMIDAGTLEVKIRNGSMLVSMSSDVLFPPGGTRLKSAAKEAISELAQTIATFPDRKFQVIGHSDATPIRTPRFPSNWELSSQRAIEVVKLMVEAGVPPTMLSSAGAAEFDPLVENDTEENKLANRRVEVVFVPKIDELPGFEKAKKVEEPEAAPTPTPISRDMPMNLAPADPKKQEAKTQTAAPAKPAAKVDAKANVAPAPKPTTNSVPTQKPSAKKKKPAKVPPTKTAPLPPPPPPPPGSN
jgi:chemotaxis protein MotB